MQRPHKSIIVCTSPRSGSGLLCDYLRQTGAAGRPRPYFSADSWTALLAAHRAGDARELIATVRTAGTGNNGVFGLCTEVGGCGLSLVLRAAEEASGEAGIDAIWAAFGPPVFVWATRRDKIRQAISWWRARQTGRWRSTDPPAPLPTDVDLVAIDDLVGELVHQEAAWNDFFEDAGIAPVVLVYEDWTRRRDEMLRAVFGALGEDTICVPIDSVFARMADAHTERWRDQVLGRRPSTQ